MTRRRGDPVTSMQSRSCTRVVRLPLSFVTVRAVVVKSVAEAVVGEQELELNPLLVVPRAQEATPRSQKPCFRICQKGLRKKNTTPWRPLVSIFPPGPQTGQAPGGYGTSRATGFRRCPFFEARWFLMCALIAVKLGCDSHDRRRKRHVDTTHSIAQCSFQGTSRCLTAEAPQTCRGCKSDRLLDVRALLLDVERDSAQPLRCRIPRNNKQSSGLRRRTSEALAVASGPWAPVERQERGACDEMGKNDIIWTEATGRLLV